MSGIHYVLDKDTQQSRIEIGATLDVQYFDNPSHCDAQAVMQPSLSRPIAPLKILKYSPTSPTIEALRSLNSQLPEKDCDNLDFETNLTRYSYRYYIYTLGRIQI